MAQYYQIVGQGQSLTIEDLQRYCPNLICSDGIIVNQDDQQYQQQVVVQQGEQPSDVIVSDVQQQVVVGDGLQYQQQYIIRHEQPQAHAEFQQQQQHQQQQQALHRHQVYYTSDLPMETQVVLQQAQQIIDAQRPQHLVSSAHVLSQPTVIHPAQPPPPQPPPSPAQHGPPQTPPQPQQQQLSRASPQMMQHLQQHQQQIHMQQLQQQQQQQLQHQMQQHQHIQSQQMQPQQIQHQIVMQTAYVNQGGSPSRQPPPRLLNQALNSPGGLTLVRSPARPVRPRRQAMTRPPMPSSSLQVPRLLNPQLQQSTSSPGNVRGMAPNGAGGAVRGARLSRPGSPRVLNPHASHAQHRPPRPRTPLLQQSSQQQQQQHQLAQHVINHSQVQQRNQLKLTNQQQQILLNQPSQSHPQQPARIITPQGTIVTQTLQTSMTQHHTVQINQNGPLPQQNLNTTPQRVSPHPQQIQQQMPQQVKKVAVQPNNASDMDDLEESITAAIVQKNPVTENQNPQHQFQTPPLRQNHVGLTAAPNANQQHQLNYNPQHTFQQHLTFDHSHVQQPAQSISQLLMEPDNSEEERQFISLPNGQRMSVAEYRRIQSSRVLSQQQQASQQQQLHQQQQARESGRQTLVRSKEQQRPVQRVPPMQTQQQSNHLPESNDPVSGPSEQTAETQSAKMLIFLQNGEQRLITFTLPKESCTLQEVLEQVNVPFTEETNIQCMQNTSSEIDYFVSVGSTTRIEEMLENHPMFVGEISSRSSPSVLTQSQNSEVSTPEKGPCPDNANHRVESPEQRSPPPRYIEGMLAVCKLCGYTGYDFSRCERCKRVFTEEPKSVLASKKVELKKKEPEKLLLEKQISPEGIKLNLLKTAVKTLNNKGVTQEKKTARVRKPRGKQPDPEPVILTLSSDEEDSNSSTVNNVSVHQEQLINTKEPSLREIEAASPDNFEMDNMDGQHENHSEKPLHIKLSPYTRHSEENTATSAKYQPEALDSVNRYENHLRRH